MGLRDLKVGQWFRFASGQVEWQYRGNGWFVRAYSGGPYHRLTNLPVVPLKPWEVPDDVRAGNEYAVR